MEIFFFGDITEQMEMYANKKGMSEEKLSNLREELIKELTEEVGINIDEIEKQIDSIDGTNFNIDIEELKEQFKFYDDNINNISIKGIFKHKINNELNDLLIILEGNKAYILTKEKPKYNDKELKNLIENYKKNHNKNEIEVLVLKEIDRLKL